MIAMYGCYFPDPAHVDYNVLLEYGRQAPRPPLTADSDCLERLEPYAETDYILIFFAAPMPHEPTWSWIYNAYHSLARKYHWRTPRR